MGGAFEGVTVVDLSVYPAASIAAMHLAEFGAVVIRVDDDEPPRDLPLWLYANRGKRVVPNGARVVTDLVAAADVVIVDHARSPLDAAGLTCEELRSHNAELIHAWMPPHAPRGATAELPGDELLLWAWTGLADQQ